MLFNLFLIQYVNLGTNSSLIVFCANFFSDIMKTNVSWGMNEISDFIVLLFCFYFLRSLVEYPTFNTNISFWL